MGFVASPPKIWAPEVARVMHPRMIVSPVMQTARMHGFLPEIPENTGGIHRFRPSLARVM